MKEISAEEFLRRKANGEDLLLIDVRELWEFDEDNIGAKCFPLGELPQFLKDLEPFKDREIIIHCKTGDRARRDEDRQDPC